MNPRRRCEECGGELPGKDRRTEGEPTQGGRPARYCCAACRQRAFRRRSAQDSTGRTQPPAAAGASTPATPVRGGELPRALDSFVGRSRELSRLRTLVKSARLLTLTGPGGVGKTRLALDFAGSMRGGADGRARFVELDSLHDGTQLPEAVATALGLGERGGRSGVEMLAHTLRERSMLVVLDNCEHLAEPCAQLAAALLSRCPRLRILATSREVLRVAGERNCPASHGRR